MASARLRGSTYTAYWRQDGKQKTQGGFATEQAVLDHGHVAEALARSAARAKEHPAEKRGRQTVAGYAPGWLDGQALLEANSVEIARSALKRIMPYLGGKVRDEVTPDDVRRMLGAIRKSGLSDSTVARTLDVARHLLPKAATEGVRFRVKERRRIKVATRDQAKLIERWINPRYKLFVRAAFETGCRWGEFVALRGEDVEKRGSGYVVRSRRTVAEVGRDCTERGYGKTESAVRDITVSEDLARELAAFGGELCFPGPRAAT